MGEFVDLKAKPYNLSDEDVAWVEDTITGMSIEEKIGQLFFNMGSSRTEEYLKITVDKYHIGGNRYNPGTAADGRASLPSIQESVLESALHVAHALGDVN